MADTYTTSLELRLQTVGGNNNTWGGYYNTTITNIDTAIAGTVSKSFSSSDVTLSAAENRNPIVVCTGTLSANVNLIVETQKKNFWVYNNTSGAYSLTVKTSGGTGVAITQGYWSKVYCDGTNVQSVVLGAVPKTYVDSLIASSALPDADYGDITVSGTASVFSINSGVVDTTELAASSVTTAKIANNNVTVGKLEGGTSSASGRVLVSDGDSTGTWSLADGISATQSTGSNGYCKLPGGLIMQWGYEAITGTTATVTFPLTFPTACRSENITDYFNGDVNGTDNNSVIRTLASTTSFGVSTSSGKDGFFWMAIGY